MKITIKDVAKELGICYSSVSRALNGKPGVSDDTRNKIKQQAKMMGYEPNYVARSLVNKSTRTIGVIVPDIINPFFCAIVTGITESASEKGYDVFLCVSNWEFQKEKEYVKTLKNKQVDGIILKPASDKDKTLYSNVNIPLLFLESWFSSKNAAIVEVDNRKGGYMAAKHLMECGYKQAGMIGGHLEAFSTTERLKGFKEALWEEGILLDDKSINNGNPFTVEGGYEATKKLLKNNKKIDAIFAANDVMALGAMQYLSENNINVPNEIGIIGFDDITYAKLPQIMMTTIKQPKEELGKIAMDVIYDFIKKGEHYIPKRIILEPELIVRNTTLKGE